MRQVKQAARRTDARYSVDLTQRRSWCVDEAPTETPPETTGGQAAITQDTMNRIAGEARDAGRKTALSDLLKELSVDNTDELKATLKAARNRDDADKSETQKAADATLKATKERDDLKAQLDGERAARLEDKRHSAVSAAAARAGAVEAEDVVAWSKAYAADAYAAALNADGAPDAKKIDALVADAKLARAHFFKAGGVGSPSNAVGKAPTGDMSAARLETKRLVRF